MKRFCFVLVLALFITGSMTAAAPLPNTIITLVEGTELPATMNVGEQYTVEVDVTSDQPFLGVQAMPSFAYPGKGVVAVRGGDHAAGGTSAHLEVTFQAKSSTAKMENGVAAVYVVVGVRYPGGIVVPKEYLFNVKVP
jgi:hypothetical protein